MQGEANTETSKPVPEAVAAKTVEQTQAELLDCFDDRIPLPKTTDADFSFFFREIEETITKPDGSVEKTGVKTKRPTVKLKVPVPSIKGLMTALMDPKQQAFILDAVSDKVKEAVRDQVNDEVKPVMKQEDLDLSKVTIEYLANLPPSQRGGGISKDTWEEFLKDYTAVMTKVQTDKTADQIAKAGALLLAKYQPVKLNKKLITVLKGYNDLWYANTSQTEQFADVNEFLSKKAEEFLNMTEETLLANI